MLTAADIMTRDVITVSPETEITTAAKILLEQKINGLPVVDEDGVLVGIICQSDLITQQKKLTLPSYFAVLDSFIPLKSSKRIEREIEKMAAATVSQAMSVEPVSVAPSTSIEEIATLMVDKNFHTIPVLEDGRLVGIIGMADALKHLSP